MKRVDFLMAFLFLASFSVAQNDYRILFKTGAVVPMEKSYANKAVFNDETGLSYTYGIIQFYALPSNALKNELKTKGIELMEYIPHNAYLAKVGKNTNQQVFEQGSIRSFYRLQPQQKTSELIQNGKLPEWALTPDNRAKVKVKIYSKTDWNQLQSFIFSKDGIVISQPNTVNVFEAELPITAMNDLLKNTLVQYVEPIAAPDIKDDTEGRSLHRSNAISTDYSGGRKYDGTGVVIGLADDGLIGPHIDYEGRLTQYTSTDQGTHGDMTAGIMFGAGNLNPRIKGMAYGAYMHYYSISGYVHVNNAVDNLNSLGTVITSTSYSQGTGGRYTTDAVFIDQQINENPVLMHVFSAGNAGFDDHGYGAGAGWANITGGYKASKNVIACGNLNNKDVLEGSSSRGPADDGRIKPDICANGINQLSTDAPNTYQIGGGTSAAAPGVAGVFTQLYHAYKENNGGNNPETALIKAAMLNTAQDLGNPGPDFQHGWGRVNALRAVRVIENNTYFTDTISNGGTHTYNIVVPTNTAQLRVMCYWADVEGVALASRALVNNININVKDPSLTTYNPWVLDPTPIAANLNANAIRGIDSLNNVEQVTIDNPTSGTYEVSIEGFAIPLGPQRYYLVYDIVSNSVELTYPVGGEGFVPGETEILRWDAQGNTGTFTLQYSLGGSWIDIVTNVGGDIRHYDWTVPNTQSANTRVRIVRNSSTSTSNVFTIARVPSNLRIVSVCPDTITVAWNSLSSTSVYEVSMLGEKYMDALGTTTETSFHVGGLNPNEGHWFSVRIVGGGLTGRRALAVYQSPGLANCILRYDIAVSDVISPLAGDLPSCLDFSSTPVTVLVENIGGNPASNFPISYKMNNGSTVTETFTGTLQPGEQVLYTFANNVNMSSAGDYQFSIWSSWSADLGRNNDTINVRSIIVSAPTVAAPLVEDFESFDVCSTTSNCGSGICVLKNGWINSANTISDDIDWRTDANGTPTSETGPTVDYAPGTSTGKYLYLESSGASCDLKLAKLITPCIDLTAATSAQLDYAYHMYGEGMGELHVDLISGNVLFEDITYNLGNNGDKWKTDKVDLSEYTGKKVALIFRGITGIDGKSDLAIDGISILNTTSVEELKAMDLTVKPNPTNGIFTVQTSVKMNDAVLRVYNTLGKEIYAQKVSNSANVVSIDLSTYADGLYYLKLENAESTYMSKVIKQ